MIICGCMFPARCDLFTSTWCVRLGMCVHVPLFDGRCLDVCVCDADEDGSLLVV